MVNDFDQAEKCVLKVNCVLRHFFISDCQGDQRPA
jgi:hypothetical protein